MLYSQGYGSVIVVFQHSLNKIHESGGRGCDCDYGHGHGRDDDRGDGCDCGCDHVRGFGDCGNGHGQNHPKCGDYVRNGHVRYGQGYDQIGCGHDHAGGGHDDRGYHVYDGHDESDPHNLGPLTAGLGVELKFGWRLPGRVVLIVRDLQDSERLDASS